MDLSYDLISQFAKVVNKDKKQDVEATVYGTIRTDSDGNKYVQLDGSDQLTPIDDVTATTKDEDRVSVSIKNHTATVTGNLSAPAVNSGDVAEDIARFNKVVTDQIDANYAHIQKLQTEKAEVSELRAAEAEIEDLRANKVSVKDLEAINGTIENLDTTYANIDFTNIDKATMAYFYAQSGLIKDVVVGDQTITGELVGVTISGDLIEGNTVVAEKLVIKGSDGLYYKLNTDGMKVEAQQTDYNSINGQVIKAKSITATKISVSDLVAFDATIGGFNITDSALYSGVKDSVNNTSRGIYLDKDGQISIGDTTNFLKYYKDTDGSYKLAISAKSISISSGTDVETAINNIQNGINDAAKTASNFLSYDSTNGLQIGNKTSGSWSGFRTRIKSNAFYIINTAGQPIAEYAAKLVELGRNATDAVIKFCGGKGQINYDDTDDCLQLSADNVRLKGVEMASLYSNYTDSDGIFRNGAVHAEPGNVQITAGGGSDNSNIYVNPTNIHMSSENYYISGTMNDSDNGGEYVSVTTGTAGIWAYKKYSNGDLEMWGSYDISNLACTTAMGSLYRTAVFSPNAFPNTVYTPNVTASYESDGYGAFLWATTTATTTKPPSYYLVRATSGTIASGKINFHVYGKWKQ